MEFANAYAAIIKADKNDDGTLTVYGKATDDSIDMDNQICDATWLDRAMPEWMKSGGNIREQHSNIAAGVAKELESKADGHYISVLVVDPVSVKKVEAGVLKGFSIGIKSPRVVRDTKAVNGRIIDGQIIEISLVDRPANPNAKLIMAKSVEGESSLVQVEELHEYKAPLPSDLIKQKTDYESINQGGKDSEPADKELYSRVKAEAKKKFDVYPSAVANAWVVREYKKRGGKYQKKTDKTMDTEKGSKMDQLKQITELAKSLTPDTVKFNKEAFDKARTALAELIVVEATEMATEGSNEKDSIEELLDAVKHLFNWYEGEIAEGEVQAPMNGDLIELSTEADTVKSGCDHESSCSDCSCDGCKACKDAGGCDNKMCEKCAYMMAKKSATIDKCLECGCHKPSDAHGRSDVTTAEIIAPTETPKSAEADEVPAEVVAEAEPVAEEIPVAEVKADEISESDSSDNDGIEAVVEKAVKSAMESVKAEIDSLRAEKESAVKKSMSLETELATALSKSVAGGPKRTAITSGAQSNEYLVKAATYKAKADATTDPVLAKGYKALYAEFSAKAGLPVASENE
jgi:hypothetical protein